MEKSVRWKIIIALVLLLIASFSAMQIVELRAEEPRRAVVAMEMFWSGKWLVPTIHEWAYYNKPPLFNWILATFFYLLGSMDEWVVRLPALLAFLATAATIFATTRKYINADTAILAAFFYLTFGDFILYGSINTGEMDLLLTYFTFLQILSIFHFYQRKQFGWLFVVSYIFTALNFLMKGLPSVVFQGFTLLTFFIVKKDFKILFRIQHVFGVLIFAGLVSAYFFTYNLQGDGLAYFTNLFQESTQKSAVESKLYDIGKHIVSFLPQLLSLLLPWSLVLLFFVFRSFSTKWEKNPLLYFCLLFLSCNLWIYWISPGTVNRYLYPFFPFIAILFAAIALKSNFSFKFWITSIIIVLVVKVIFNFTVLPYQQNNYEHLIYRALSKKIIAAAHRERIYFTGETVMSVPAVTFSGKTWYSDTLFTPPTLPYQLPYYLGKAQQQPMTYHPQPIEGLYYLAYEDFIIHQQVEVFYRFQEKWTNRIMVLVKFK